jgi:signal transduction histidine kinase
MVAGGALLLTHALLVAGLLRQRAGRKQAERSLGHRLRFETALSEQAARFSSVSAAEVDGEIERALERIADVLEVDWGSLAEYSPETRQAQNTYRWVARGVPPPPATIGFDEIPWVVAQLRRGLLVRFASLEELPGDGAAVDRQTYRALGVRSQVAVPLVVEGAVIGALAFGSVTRERAWPDEFVQRLRLLGETFASTLSRRRAELEGQRLRQDLAHVGRVATMGELAASLAHEINQPLTAILSNAQAARRLLAADRADLAEIGEILADIVEDDKRAGQVINRLRGFLKKGEAEHARLDVGELVREVARLVSSDALLRNVAVHLQLEPGLPPVLGDRVQIQQVMLNLLLNGLDAMQGLDALPQSDPGARRLVVQTRRHHGNMLLVEVRDTGPGLIDGERERVFDPFYTTKANGLGMGLAIARSIVEAHGGRLDAGNAPEGGAAFSFTLPLDGRAP